MASSPTIERNELSASIEILRPLLIILVCWAHTPFLFSFIHPIISADNPVTIFGVFIRDTFSRGGVPILTLISGYLAYLTISRKSYAVFVGEKFVRILIPFLVWNAIMLAFMWLIYARLGSDPWGEIGRLESAGDAITAIVGYNRLPINAPTYFLRDLFLILLITPIIEWITRDRVVALACVAALAVMVMTVIPVGIVLFDLGLLYRNDMPLFFLAGFVFARHGPLLQRTRDWKALVSIGLFVAVCAASAYWLAAYKPHIFEFLRYRPLIGMLLIVLLPYLVSYIVGHKDCQALRALSKLSRFSFVIFLSHMLVVYSYAEIARINGFHLSNISPLPQQMLFLVIYTALCIIFGVAIKLAYERILRLLGRN